MSEPIKAGDVCEVVSGAFEEKGPNVGKQVTVISLRGEHSLYGRIWQCSGPDLITEFGAVGNVADFAANWLRKIPPNQLTKKTETKNELTV